MSTYDDLNTVNHSDMVDLVADRVVFHKTTIDNILRAQAAVIEEAFVRGCSVRILKVGKLDVKERPPRTYHNIHTGEKGTSTGGRKVVFKASASLQRDLDGLGT